MKHLLLATALVFALAACSGNKADAPPASPQPTVTGEKSFSYPPFDLKVGYKGDRVVFTIATKTTGWIGVGFGSAKMNTAHIFMGSIDQDKPVFSEQEGTGHTHALAKTTLALDHAIVQNGDTLTMTVECKKTDVIAAGAKQLDMVMSTAVTDNMTVKHVNRQGVTIQLE